MLNRSQAVETTHQTTPIRTPFDLRDALEEDRTAMLALGGLLKTASLVTFDPGECERGTVASNLAQDLQYGLSRLIWLCVESQTRTVDSYVAQYKDSDAYLLKRAEGILHVAEQGAFRPGRGHEELLGAIGLTTIVAQRRGQLADTAKALETRIASLLKKCQAGKGSQERPAPSTDSRGEEVAQ